MKFKAYCTKCGNGRTLPKRPEQYVSGCQCKLCNSEMALVPIKKPWYLQEK